MALGMQALYIFIVLRTSLPNQNFNYRSAFMSGIQARLNFLRPHIAAVNNNVRLLCWPSGMPAL